MTRSGGSVTKPPRQAALDDYCVVCGDPVEQPATGRRRRTCSARCRKRLSRNGRRGAEGRAFRDNGKGICEHCGRSWGGHAGRSCFGPSRAVDRCDDDYRLERGLP
jgi:predicted nucleic acid-binding Zn ribbon protein